MNKIIVSVFNTEAQSAAALRKVQQLHIVGYVTLYATAVFSKDANGEVKVHQVDEQAPVATGLGMLVGGLVGALAGPAGMVAGAALGGLGGSLADLYESGVDARFADDVAAVLEPGKVALVLDIDEEWTAPVDAALTEEGGVIFRNSRANIEDARWESDLAADIAEAQALKAEWQAADEAAKAEMQAQYEAAKQKAADKKAQWQAKLDKAKVETENKVKHAEEQLKHASDEQKAKIQARIDKTKANFETRKAKLAAASDLIKDALS